MPDLLLELFSEEIPARMQAKAADDLRRMSPISWSPKGSSMRARRRSSRRGAWRSPCTAFRRAARPEGARATDRARRAGSGDSGLSESAGLDRSRKRRSRRDPEGRVLCRSDREARPRHHRRDRGDLPAIVRTFPWPKSMRWGGVRPNPARCAGCGRCIRSSAPSDPKPRSPRSCASRSTASRLARSPTAIASWRRGDLRPPLRRLRAKLKAARSCSTRPAQGDHPRRRQELAFAQGLDWSRTRGCSRKSRASSNGRSC